MPVSNLDIYKAATAALAAGVSATSGQRAAVFATFRRIRKESYSPGARAKVAVVEALLHEALSLKEKGTENALRHAHEFEETLRDFAHGEPPVPSLIQAALVWLNYWIYLEENWEAWCETEKGSAMSRAQLATAALREKITGRACAA